MCIEEPGWCEICAKAAGGPVWEQARAMWLRKCEAAKQAFEATPPAVPERSSKSSPDSEGDSVISRQAPTRTPGSDEPTTQPTLARADPYAYMEEGRSVYGSDVELDMPPPDSHEQQT